MVSIHSITKVCYYGINFQIALNMMILMCLGSILAAGPNHVIVEHAFHVKFRSFIYIFIIPHCIYHSVIFFILSVTSTMRLCYFVNLSLMLNKIFYFTFINKLEEMFGSVRTKHAHRKRRLVAKRDPIWMLTPMSITCCTSTGRHIPALIN